MNVVFAATYNLQKQPGADMVLTQEIKLRVKYSSEKKISPDST